MLISFSPSTKSRLFLPKRSVHLILYCDSHLAEHFAWCLRSATPLQLLQVCQMSFLFLERLFDILPGGTICAYIYII